MATPDTDQQIQLVRLGSLLNIMERELYEFSESADTGAIPQRIDDFRALVTSMKGIVQKIQYHGVRKKTTVCDRDKKSRQKTTTTTQPKRS